MLYHLPVLNKTISSFERLIPTKRPDLSLKSTGENRQPSRETVALFELNARFDAQIFNAYDTDDVLNSNRKSIGWYLLFVLVIYILRFDAIDLSTIYDSISASTNVASTGIM